MIGKERGRQDSHWMFTQSGKDLGDLESDEAVTHSVVGFYVIKIILITHYFRLKKRWECFVFMFSANNNNKPQYNLYSIIQINPK